MYFKSRDLFALSSLLVFVSACASLDKNKPHLVPNSEILKQSSPLFGGFIDQIQSIPVIGQTGEDIVSNQDGFLNDGKPFDALKVVIKGDAFTSGYLAPPKGCSVEIRTKRGEAACDRGAALFWPDGEGVYVAIVPITCKDIVSLQFKIPCLKEGSSDFEIQAGPKDGSAPALSFRHPVKILPKMKSLMKMLEKELKESSERTNTPLPVPVSPLQTSGSTGIPAESAPTTQYEIQKQLLKQQQEQDAANKDD